MYRYAVCMYVYVYMYTYIRIHLSIPQYYKPHLIQKRNIYKYSLIYVYKCDVCNINGTNNNNYSLYRIDNLKKVKQSINFEYIDEWIIVYDGYYIKDCYDNNKSKHVYIDQDVCYCNFYKKYVFKEI